MADTMLMTFVATGENYGKSFKWRANAFTHFHTFVDGVLKVWVRPEAAIPLARNLATNLAAFPLGSAELTEALKHHGQLSIQEDSRRRGSEEVLGGGVAPGGASSASGTAVGGINAGAEAGSISRISDRDGLSAAIYEACKKLNADDPGSWTQDGRPTVAAVARIMGNETITRDMINAAAPGYNREMAALM